MKVLIISANREEINMRTWPLGAACVAAAAEQSGHDVEFLDLMQVQDPQAEVSRIIKKFQPQVIGLSVRNVDDQSMADTKFFLGEVKELILLLKRLTNVPIVLGGAGYSIFPSAMLEYLDADMGIQGEGETAFVELLDRLETGEEVVGLPGLYLPGNRSQVERLFVKDLDVLPLPGSQFLPDSYLQEGEEFWLPVQTRRGCPMRCSYCSTATIEGCVLRRRSPERIVQWMGQWADLGVRRYHFVDNTFNLPQSYAKELCRELIRAKLSPTWRCIVYPFHVDDELAQLMAEAGCVEVSVGFESGSALVLSGMNKRFGTEDVRRVCEALGRYGVHRMGFLMLGGPDETEESALESLEFADSLNLECVKVTVGIRIYPYTALAKTAVDDGTISPDDDLLLPRFYIAHGLGDWLRETVDQWMSTRPTWVN
ncbi:MAG: B12-binding domain-containing radical SAM protein [Thermodesulfobacteriota bacterium]